MTTIFTSYSRREPNKTFAHNLHAELSQKYGEDQAWIDSEDIKPSTKWLDEIRKGIETADSFILVMNEESLCSPACHLEIYHARQLGKRIIPIRFQEFTPDALREPFMKRIQESHNEFARTELSTNKVWAVNQDDISDNKYWAFAYDNLTYLSTIQYLSFGEQDDFAAKFAELIEVIEKDLVHVRQHTRLLTQALEWQENNTNWSFLLVGEEIQRAEAWLKRADELLKDDEKKKYLPEPTTLHHHYISRSRRQSTYRQRVYRGLAAILGGIFGIAIMTSVYMVWSINEAIKAQYAAEQSELVAQFNSGAVFYYVAEYALARGIFEATLPLIDTPFVEQYEFLAATCMQLRDFECVETNNQHILALEPTRTSAYRSLAMMYREIGEFDEAQTMLTKALEVYRSNGKEDILYSDNEYIFTRVEGSLAFYQDDWQGVIDLLDPIDTKETYLSYRKEIVYYLAVSYQKLGNRAKACELWEQYAVLPLTAFALYEQDREDDANRLRYQLKCQ